MELNLEFLATIGHLMTGFGTIILAILVFRTFQHLAAASKAAEIETEYKLRPWIGPTGIIKEINSDSTKKRFEVMVKNFGDLPASDVTASSLVKLEKITRDDLKSQKNSISLGPILPNMEKRYWIDIPIEMVEKQKEGKIFTGILFEYPLSFGKSEYGLISEVSVPLFVFAHTDMWTSSPSAKSS
jgi:hypothetical protein